MSDTGKEHKLTAARSMLRQYQSRKVRLQNGSSTATTSRTGSQSSTRASSRASSCEPLNETDRLQENGLPAETRSPDVLRDVAMDSNPAYRNPSSLYATTSTSFSSANDYFTDSVKYAMGDVSLENSDPSHSNSAVMQPQTSLHLNYYTKNSTRSNFNSNDINSGTSTIQRDSLNSPLSSTDNPKEDNSSNDYRISSSNNNLMSSHGRDSSVESDHTDTTAVFLSNKGENEKDDVQTSDARGNGEVSAPYQEFNSSAASLRQISAQLQGLVTEAATFEDSSIGVSAPDSSIDSLNSSNNQQELQVLEARNSALLQQLHQQQYQLQQMSALLQEARSSASATASSAVDSAGDHSSSSAEELAQVRQQLHLHVQTVGILVAEKTQLETQVRELQHLLGSGGAELTELQGRLAASRQTVEELEQRMKQERDQLGQAEREKEQLVKESEQAGQDRERLKARCIDQELRASELAERVSSSGRDQQSAHRQLTDTKTQLHMANIRVEQLRNSSGDSANILDELNQEKKSHQETQEQLCQVRQQMAQQEQAKAEVVAQCQLYTTQLTAHSDTLQTQLTETQKSKEQMDAQLQEKSLQLQQLQQQLQLQKPESASSRASAELQEQVYQLQGSSENMLEKLQQSTDTNKQLEQDNLSLSRLSEEQQRRMEQLEMAADRRQTEAVDSSSLMAKLQSDKVAAARALAQNKQLKEQLAELQDGFVMMSNKKLEVTEKLERELHLKKGLHQQLTQHQQEAQQLREAGSLREREVEQLRESCSSLALQLAVFKQRQREQEQATSVPDIVPKTEASGSLDCVEDNNKEQYGVNGSVCLDGQSLTVPAVEDHRQQLSSEADTSSLSDVSSTTAATTRSSSATTSSSDIASCVSGETPSGRAALLEYRLAQLSATHSQLVERFQRSMEQVAQLSDDRQQLEVTIEQLQLENDTIGDYITIYQFKRGVLSQRMREKELEVDKLTGDRQTIMEKLTTLQELIVTLSKERGETVVVGGGLLSSIAQLLAPDPPAEATAPIVDNNNSNCTDDATDNSTSTAAATSAPSNTEQQTDAQLEQGPPSATVTRILELIKEMEAGPTTDTRSLHPCSLCSGSLITV